MVSKRLLYFRTERRGQLCDDLVILHFKTRSLTHLAHSHQLRSHLGAHKTLAKLRHRFLWPDMDADIRAFCQQCPQCQRTAPQKPPPCTPHPTPIIGVPFERVGMYLVVLLPKSAWGQ